MEQPWEIITYSDNLEEDLKETVERIYQRDVTKEQLIAQHNIEVLQDSFSEKLATAQRNYPTWSKPDLETQTTIYIEKQVNAVHLHLEKTIEELKNLREFRLQAVETYIQAKTPVSSG